MFEQRADRMGLRGACAAIVFLFALGGGARAGENYYLLMFGSQRFPNAPAYAHTFATFVRVVCGEDGAPCLEAHTISWLPRTLDIRICAKHPECAVNLDLAATLRYVADNGERVSLWGPFQIDRDLYRRAVARQCVLESGQVEYKALDFGYPVDRASNCFHAVSSVVGGNRLHIAPLAWGETASFRVLREFRPWIINPCATHPWVAQALGLDCYPIIYRQPDEHPHSGCCQGPLGKLLGCGKQVEASYGPP
jgi:hypothetical protein